MLGLGWTELLVIGVVALVVIGPKELPAVMRRVGQFAGQVRRMGGEFQRELNKTTGLNEMRNLRDSVAQPLKATADAIRKEFNTTTPTGEVKPSGLLKPADPKAESVVDEIRAKAGLPTKAELAEADKAATAAAGPATSEPVGAPKAAAKPPVKAAAAPRLKPINNSPVSSTDLPAAAPAGTGSGIESPAPIEAVAKPARKPAAAKAAPPKSPVAKAAAPKRPVAKSVTAAPEAATATGVSPTAAPAAEAAKPVRKRRSAAVTQETTPASRRESRKTE